MLAYGLEEYQLYGTNGTLTLLFQLRLKIYKPHAARIIYS